MRSRDELPSPQSMEGSDFGNDFIPIARTETTVSQVSPEEHLERFNLLGNWENERLIQRLELASENEASQVDENIMTMMDLQNMADNGIYRFFNSAPGLSTDEIYQGFQGLLPNELKSRFEEWKKVKATEVKHQAAICGVRCPPIVEAFLDEEQLSKAPSTTAGMGKRRFKRSNSNLGPLSKLPRWGFKGFIASMHKSTRFVMFNTEQTTKCEFYQHLKERLWRPIFDGITKVECVLQPNGRRRIDFWVLNSVSGMLKHAMLMHSKGRREGTRLDPRYPMNKLPLSLWKPNAVTRNWRLDYWRAKRDRPETSKNVCIEPTPCYRSVMTFNVNGLKGKRGEIERLLHSKKIGIAALQETRYSVKDPHLVITDYEVFQRHKQPGFPGLALAVHRSLTAYLVEGDVSNHYIHVRVSKVIEGDMPWHIFGVYLPSGGNYRKVRGETIRKLIAICKEIRRQEPMAKIVLLGDWNTTRNTLEKALKPNKSGLKCHSISGCGLTFKRKNSKRTDIDTIVVNEPAKNALKPAKVLLNWGVSEFTRNSHGKLVRNSDHVPVVAKVRAQPPPLPTPVVRWRFDPDKTKLKARELVNDNRWMCLPVEPIIESAALDMATEVFTETLGMIAEDLNVKVRVGGRPYHLSRGSQKLLRRMRDAKKRWKECPQKGSSQGQILYKNWMKVWDEARRQTDKERRQHERKIVKKVTELYESGEMRRFHNWESKVAAGKGTNSTSVTPVKKKSGHLLTNEDEIRKRVTEYYQELAQDIGNAECLTSEFWKGKAGPRKPELPVNDQIQWREVMAVIRKMQLNTAAGTDLIPVEMMRALFKEECRATLQKKGIAPKDLIDVALPEGELLNEPVTPMGIHLYRIICGIWTTSGQPGKWEEAIIASLHKTGDPTDLQNYRGISLIAVGMKVVTSILASRITMAMEANDLFYKGQAGYRNGEEAVAQFISLTEIIKRRRGEDKKTYAVFIDFKKAFDRVYHEALFEKMDALGFRGKFLELVKNIYKSSKAAARVGNQVGESFSLLRGTRQGCPLSPVLFILFINDFMEYLPKGVIVPKVNKEETPKKCPGFLFADDIVALTHSMKGLMAVLKGTTKWCDAWGMDVGAAKCGILLCGGKQKDISKLEQHKHELCIQNLEIPIVTKYKYLGIVISNKSGDGSKSDEIEHCKVLAEKVRKATNIRYAFLRNNKYPLQVRLAVIMAKIIPLGLYGGEWIAFRQCRTAKIQTQVNRALKIALQSSASSKLHVERLAALELNVPTIEERVADLRVRLLHKAPTMKGWLKDLVEPDNCIQGRKGERYWASMTRGYLLTTLDDKTKVALPGRAWMSREVALYQEDSGRLEEWRDSNDPIAKRQKLKCEIVTRDLYIDVYTDKSKNRFRKASEDYYQWNLMKTRHYIKAAQRLTVISEGVTWLARMRIGAWWTTKRASIFNKWRGNAVKYNATSCPCCNSIIGPSELTHILLKCNKWVREREVIQPLIGAMTSLINEHGSTTTNVDLEMTWRLLGADISDIVGATNRGLDVTSAVKNKGAESPGLTLLATTWSGNSGVVIPGVKLAGFCLVAAFLGKVMPRHRAALFEPKETDSSIADSSVDERSPMKKQTPKGFFSFMDGVSGVNLSAAGIMAASHTKASSGMVANALIVDTEEQEHNDFLTNVRGWLSNLESRQCSNEREVPGVWADM
jgi:hypothetical protein